MSVVIESLEKRRFLSASAINAQFDPSPGFIAKQSNYLSASATHDQATVVSNVATVDWGDRTPKQAVSVYWVDPTAAQMYSPHTYQKPGVYRARVTFYEGADVASQITEKIHVTQISPGGKTLQARTGRNLTTVYGIFSATKPIYSAIVDFGDGTRGIGVVKQLDDGTYQVTSGHTYSSPGLYSVYIAGNGVLYPPYARPDVAQSIPIPLYSSVRVTGPAVTPTIPQVQLTSVIPPTIKPGDFPEIATATGIPNDPYEQVYVTIDWSQGETTYGSVTFNDDGSADIKTSPTPTTTSLTTLNFTLKVYINDHLDARQNTLIGTLTGATQVDPGPAPASGYILPTP